MKTPEELKNEFISAVAAYLVSDMAVKSIFLQMGKADAKAWARAYDAAGCHGWSSQEAAEASIRRILAL